MSSDNKPRLVPNLMVVLFLLAHLAVLIWLQVSDGAGDTGMNNVFSYMAVMMIAAVYGIWFLGFSGQSTRVRGGVVLGVVVLLLGVRSTVVVENWSGSMVPRWHWSWDSKETVSLESGAVAAQAGVDLLTTTPADFPGFQGPLRDGTVPGVKLDTDWIAHAPEQLWKVPVGFGWSGFAVVNGVALTHEQRGAEQLVVARSLEDGSELWRFATDSSMDHMLGGKGPHATPQVHEGRVYAQDTAGVLVCLDGATGALLWERDLSKEYGMTPELEEEFIQYGRSSSPLIVGDLCIVPVGGNPEVQQAGLVAFDRLSGGLRWEGPARQVSHASPNYAVLAGTPQILVLNEDTISAHVPYTGVLLWEHPWKAKTAADPNNSSPLPVGEDMVLITKGYGLGSSLLQLTTRQDGSLSVEALWSSRRSLRTKFTNAVVRGEHAYALSDGILECVSMADGKRVWKDGRYGHGQMLLVGEHLLLLSEEGELLIIAATPEEENQVLARMQALEGTTWNTFALYGDIVVLRNGVEAGAWRLPVLAN
ncbi:MAG: outer membrane protein assembly factor BamB [Planctomycetota bacterium]|jgi:outer membrane protein assembly factor BamB